MKIIRAHISSPSRLCSMQRVLLTSSLPLSMRQADHPISVSMISTTSMVTAWSKLLLKVSLPSKLIRDFSYSLNRPLLQLESTPPVMLSPRSLEAGIA